MYGCINKCGCGGLAKFTVWRIMVCCVFCRNSFCEFRILLPHNPASNMYPPLLTKSSTNIPSQCFGTLLEKAVKYLDYVYSNSLMQFLKCKRVLFDVNIFHGLFSLMTLFACVWRTFFVHSWRALVRRVYFGSSC